MTLQHTPLNAVHRSLNARMVDFGGWDMPVSYGSQIEEHHAVRRDAGIFDVSHMCVIDLTGAQARPFLRTLLANNVDRLQTPGRALYSCMLNIQGGVLDDLIVYFFREDWFRLVVNAGTAPTDLAWIAAQNAAAGAAVTITPRRADHKAGLPPLGIVAVQGPNARARTYAALPGVQAVGESLQPFCAGFSSLDDLGEIMIARTGYTGEDGFELIAPAAQIATIWQRLLQAGARPCGLGARDTLRLEAGMNLYGQDMDAHVSPLDAGLAWTVDLHSGRDFIGRAALCAHGQRQQLAGLLLRPTDGKPGGVLRAHQKIITAAGDGEITSGTFSPSLSRSIALARLPKDIAIGADVQVEIRDRMLPATVVKPPFVRHGKVLIP